jgi:hypothetical protein
VSAARWRVAWKASRTPELIKQGHLHQSMGLGEGVCAADLGSRFCLEMESLQKMNFQKCPQVTPVCDFFPVYALGKTKFAMETRRQPEAKHPKKH